MLEQRDRYKRSFKDDESHLLSILLICTPIYKTRLHLEAHDIKVKKKRKSHQKSVDARFSNIQDSQQLPASASTSLPQHHDIRFALNDILDLRGGLTCSATYFVETIRTGKILVDRVIFRFVATRCARDE